MRALLAEMELVRLAVDQVGDMEGGRLIALLAFHDIALTPREPYPAVVAPTCSIIQRRNQGVVRGRKQTVRNG